MEDEEQQFIEDLRIKIHEDFDELCEKYGADTSVYELDVKLIVKSVNGNKVQETQIIQPEKQFCGFCGKESLYYSSKVENVVCAECWHKMEVES